MAFALTPFRAASILLACALLVPGLAGADDKATTPKDGPIRLFNGKDLEGNYTWLQDAKYEDPRKVFTAHDGLLHLSGDGFGAIVTKETYRDYHLIIEFKWGERTWQTRQEKARDSGVLVHCNGDDGNYNGIWMNSIEAQIIEGGCGDILAVRGKDAKGELLPISVTAETAKDRDGETVWKAGGERKTIQRGRINWFGRDPDWADKKGFRGKDDVESPFGQWTRMDVVCDKQRVTIFVNGVKVNEAIEVAPASGKIQIQAELAEMFVRRWELWPLGKAPEFRREQLKP